MLRIPAIGTSPDTRCHPVPARTASGGTNSPGQRMNAIPFSCVRCILFFADPYLLQPRKFFVDGHVMQGDGCTARNLTSLVRHILAIPSIDVVVDFLLQAIKKRRDDSRRIQFPFQ